MTAAIMIISGCHASSRRFFPYYSLSSLQRHLHTSHPSRTLLHRYRGMVVEMTRRRIHGNGDSADKAKSPTGAVGERERHDAHGPSNIQPHTHTHPHGIFGGHSHAHSHGHDGHDHGGGLIETLQSGGAHLSSLLFVYYDAHASNSFRIATLPSLATYRLVSYREGDRGSRVTLVGLGANVLLTGAKGAAGWYMNSAALLADAGHSLSGKHVLQPVSLLYGAALLYMSLEGGLGFVPPPSHMRPRRKAITKLTCRFLDFDTCHV